MALNLQNIDDARNKLSACDTATYVDAGQSFRHFLRKIKVNQFRHISGLTIDIEHPVTAISGSNKTGKTSVLLLVACSHENFQKIDATAPTPILRKHAWNDVLTFTSHENVTSDYSYQLDWRLGNKNNSGEGKRLATSAAWSGLGKKSSDTKRINAKIRDRHVRFTDLERIVPGRSFSRTLVRKANSATKVRLHSEIEQAFAYVFGLPSCEIYEVGGHINKSCFFVITPNSNY